jgi:Fic family protein
MQPLPEPLCDFSNEAIATSILDEWHERFQAANLNKRIHPKTIDAIRIELTYNSNAIEGNTLSLRDTLLVVEGSEPNSGKSLREIYEARNHYRAIGLIESWANQPLTAEMIQTLHVEVMAEIDREYAGKFRDGRVMIQGVRFVPPGAHKFPVLIPQMLELANRGGVHPVVQAAELHYNFVAIHPFFDGNGRTARLLFNHHLLRHGYPLTIVPVEQRGIYMQALEAANAGQTAPLTTFLIQCVIDTAKRILGEEES